MTIPDILLAMVGFLFFSFIPGFLLVKLFFNDNEKIEQVILAIIISIMLAMTIGIFFGYDRAQRDLTGGFTVQNLWMGEVVITAALLIMHLIRYSLRKRFNNKKALPGKKK